MNEDFSENGPAFAESYGRPPAWIEAFRHSRSDPFRRTTQHLQFSTSSPTSAYSYLNPNAQPFIPDNTKSQFRNQQTIETTIETSTAENLRDRLTEQLERETYECMICCQLIFAHQWIWTCQQCFHMFHFHRKPENSCITRWAMKSFRDEDGWRCPGCQGLCEQVPAEYRCFCAKELQPRTRRGLDIPHSCGHQCHKLNGEGCPHKCTLPCHPGPCPLCPRTVNRKCRCGILMQSVRCGSSDQINCGKVCGKMLNCGKHECAEVCHEGSCDNCRITFEEVCHCGRETRQTVCTALNLQSSGFSCGRPCQGRYQCQIHDCQLKCHQGDCGQCPLDPRRLVRCPCGKSTLTGTPERLSCTDLVPTCSATCDKVLGCGSQSKPHRCKAKCHMGPCPQCPNNSSLRCRCKALNKTVLCSELANYSEERPLLCEKRCKKTKSCKTHKCQEKCCVDGEHLCLQICNRQLDCAMHRCERLCHVGQCGRCLRASFDEQRCLCGRTVRDPPVACGAALPLCDHLCARDHPSCQHPVTHNCHAETDCPPCTFLTQKLCYCARVMRNNIPCYLNDVSCGNTCNKPLPCQVHYCNRMCHAGDCVKKQQDKCKQLCPFIRPICGHPCAVPCHGQTSCPEQTLCSAKVQTTCSCGRQSQSMNCVEVERLWLMRTEQKLASQSDQAPITTIMQNTSRDKFRCLQCDCECARTQRNKRLAEAMDIDRPVEDSQSVLYTDYLKYQAALNKEAVIQIENVLVRLVHETCAQRHSSWRSHVFRPMSGERRRLLHEYAAYFRLETVSYDPEPHRNIVATAKRGVSVIPKVLLSSFCPTQATAPARLPHPSSVNPETPNESAFNVSNTDGLATGMHALTLSNVVVRGPQI